MSFIDGLVCSHHQFGGVGPGQLINRTIGVCAGAVVVTGDKGARGCAEPLLDDSGLETVNFSANVLRGLRKAWSIELVRPSYLPSLNLHDGGSSLPVPGNTN